MDLYQSVFVAWPSVIVQSSGSSLIQHGTELKMRTEREISGICKLFSMYFPIMLHRGEHLLS